MDVKATLAPLLQKSSRARPGNTPDRQRDTFLVTRYRYIVTTYGNYSHAVQS